MKKNSSKKRKSPYTKGRLFADPIFLQIRHLWTYLKLILAPYKRKYLPLIVAVLAGNLVFLIIFSLYGKGLLQTLELFAYDVMLWSASENSPADPRITLILTTDKDQRQWGWPLSDEDLARMLERISAHGPAVIGVDLYRDFPVPRDKGKGHEHLTRVFRNTPNIIAIQKYRDDKGVHIHPPEALQGTAQVAFNDLPIDPGGVVRRGLLYMADEHGNPMEALSLKLALYYLLPRGVPIQADPENPYALLFGKARLAPLAEDYGGYVHGDMGGFQLMLNYPGRLTKFNTLSVTDVLTEAFDPALVAEKIIIIGADAEATPDFFYLPYARWLEGEQRIAGAALHAYIVSQLLRMAEGESKPLQSWHAYAEYGWIWLWCMGSALLCLWIQSAWRLSLAAAGGLALLGLAGYTAFLYRLWIPAITPALGWIISNMVMSVFLSQYTKTQRTVLMQLFSRHVSKEVAKEIWQKRDQYIKLGRLHSRRLTATVVFTDLQDFSGVAEKMEAHALMDWLNQYMEAMVQVIEDQHHGQVNKFMGDAIMAVFGVPIPSIAAEAIARDAMNAVECALSMRDTLEQLHQTWKARGLPPIRMRVGIATGALVAGSLGGRKRQEYTVIGDVVNIAARLESFNKTFDAGNICRIFISEATFRHLDDRFNTRCIGEADLKGKTSKVTIYQVA
ncbi:MAG: adenylate/guanylate cyclase domain-containing protein [Gammaproteobacteria bacterium]|nr:adenylate/guanylate cyclase domain-containing protein [Gammaproteobacteria bacterium]